MRKGNTKLFIRDKQKLSQMLVYRHNWSLSVITLAVLFGCDESSIRAQCNKHRIKPKNMAIHIPRIIAPAIEKLFEQPPFIIKGGEKINKGKSYKEYEADTKLREAKQLNTLIA